MTTITHLDDFEALDPFFRIIEKGLDGIADGGHFFDLLAEEGDYRFRCRLVGPIMGYVVNRQDRWSAVSYEGMDPLRGATVAAGTPP